MASDRDPLNSSWFREVLGQYPTGVSVITGIGEDGVPTGLVVGSFTSVSLAPPLIAFLPDKSSSSWPKIAPGGRFCVNILARGQEDICRSFAAKGGDKFAGIEWRPAGTGAPIIEGVVAWIDCELDVIHDAGDHDIVVGRVLELDVESSTEPLIFFRGGYGSFAPVSLVSGDTHLRHELHLVDRARSEMETVAADLRAQCVAWALVGDDLVLLASAGTPEHHGVPAGMIGTRIPAIPPIGATWMAYASDERLESWLSQVAPEERDDQRERVAQVRRRGYTVALRGPELGRFEVLAEHDQAGDDESLLRSLPLDPLDFSPARARDVAVVNVPVFGAGGEVELLLGVHGLWLGDEAALQRCLDRLREAASAVTGVGPAASGTN